MITSLRLRDFKNFADETLYLGPLTIIVGANASGKSNLRDAFQFLQGIGHGFTLSEIIDGRLGPGGLVLWSGIRGPGLELFRFGQDTFALHVALQLDKNQLEYSIEVGTESNSVGFFRVVREELKVGDQWIFTSHPGAGDPVHRQADDTHLLLRMAKAKEKGQRKFGYRIAVRPNQPALTQVHEHSHVLRAHKAYAEAVRFVLANMRFLDPIPEKMRMPAFPGQTVLGDRGEHLPAVLKTLWEDQDLGATLTDWINELTPMDVQDLVFPPDLLTHEIRLAIVERDGNRVSAYGMSDGTLRFLAMLAALLGPSAQGLLFFEEIDNGLHPSRLYLLLDLLKVTTDGQVQVVTTTHSPAILAKVDGDTFEDIAVVCRRSDASSAVIRRLANLPDAHELRNSQGMDRLHTSGWMEDIIDFDDEEPVAA
ncbi:MAG: AAA family ATPase [Caldilineaceae bacterium]|nr:AAA family ATPase [Caldilineaceae bacterium]